MKVKMSFDAGLRGIPIENHFELYNFLIASVCTGRMGIRYYQIYSVFWCNPIDFSKKIENLPMESSILQLILLEVFILLWLRAFWSKNFLASLSTLWTERNSIHGRK